jgi:hypothetical protein
MVSLTNDAEMLHLKASGSQLLHGRVCRRMIFKYRNHRINDLHLVSFKASITPQCLAACLGWVRNAPADPGRQIKCIDRILHPSLWHHVNGRIGIYLLLKGGGDWRGQQINPGILMRLCGDGATVAFE